MTSSPIRPAGGRNRASSSKCSPGPFEVADSRARLADLAAGAGPARRLPRPAGATPGSEPLPCLAGAGSPKQCRRARPARRARLAVPSVSGVQQALVGPGSTRRISSSLRGTAACCRIWVCCNAKTITSVTAAARASNEVNHRVAPFSSNATSRNAVLTPAAAAVAALLADSSFHRWSCRLDYGRWPPTPAPAAPGPSRRRPEAAADQGVKSSVSWQTGTPSRRCYARRACCGGWSAAGGLRRSRGTTAARCRTAPAD